MKFKAKLLTAILMFLLFSHFVLIDVYGQTFQERYLEATEKQKTLLQTNYNTCVYAALLIEQVDRRGEHFSVSGKPLHFALYNDSNGNLNVYTIKDTDIYRVNMGTNEIFHFTYNTTGKGGREYPLSFNCDAEGNLYICDKGRNWIGKYSSNGVFLGEIGTSFQFNDKVGPFPSFIREDTNTYALYTLFFVPSIFSEIVENYADQRYAIQCRREILGQQGIIFAPEQIAISREKNIFVKDFIEESRIQVFDQTTNNFVASWLEKDIIGDITPPSGSIFINNDAVATNTTTVILNLTATDTESAIGTMVISNFQDFSIAETVTFSSTKVWTLLDGEGIKEVYAKFIDISGNVSQISSDTIILDVTPPVTTISAGTPKYGETPTYITSAATITLFAIDNMSGVARTEYRLNTETFWNTYAVPFSISKEETHAIHYRSIDSAGNIENTNTTIVFVDNSAPTITINTPLSGETYAGRRDALKIDFVVIDNADSSPEVVAFLTHIDTAGETISVYAGFNTDPLNIPAGEWILTVQAKDFVENTSIETSGPFTIIHDVLPPRTSIHIGEPKYGETPVFVTSATTFTLSAIDDLVEIGDSIGLGVESIFFRIDNETWTVFTDSFTLQTEQALPLQDGEHTIYYYSVDVIGNTENSKCLVILLDNTPPKTNFVIGSPQYSPADTLPVIVSSLTTFTLIAEDTGSGVRRTEYTIDGVLPYRVGTSFSVPAESFTYGIHIISYFSIDNVENREKENTRTVFLDSSLPVAELISPSSKDYGLCKVINNETIPITGTVRDDHFLNYRVEVKKDIESDTQWQTIIESTEQKESQLLAIWNTAGFADGFYILRLTGIDRVNNTTIDTTSIYIGKPELLLSIGKKGHKPGEFNHPYGIALDDTGNIYVTDRANCRVQKFNPGGEFLKEFGHLFKRKFKFIWKKAFKQDEFTCFIDKEDFLHIIDKNDKRVKKFELDGSFIEEKKFNRLEDVFTKEDVDEIDSEEENELYYVDGKDFFCNIDRGRNIVQSFDLDGHLFRNIKDLDITSILKNLENERRDIGHFESSCGKLISRFLCLMRGALILPSGIAISSDSETPSVYVSDITCKIKVFDLNGDFLFSFGRIGKDSGEFINPKGLFIKNDNLYVADRNNNRIQIFGLEGNFIKEIKGFNKPEGVSVDNENNIYVADRNNDRVVKINQEGTATLVVRGLNKPTSVVVNDRGYIYVSNTNSDSIAKFDKYGNLIMKFSSINTITLNKPAGLAVDSKGNLLIVDENNARIVEVSAPDTETTAKGARSILASPKVSTLSITDAYAWPCPFKPSAGHTFIQFKNLTSNVALRIYNIAGELIFEQAGIYSSTYDWPVKNNFKEPIASGVYIYFLTDDTKEKKIGKIMVIR